MGASRKLLTLGDCGWLHAAMQARIEHLEATDDRAGYELAVIYKQIIKKIGHRGRRLHAYLRKVNELNAE